VLISGGMCCSASILFWNRTWLGSCRWNFSSHLAMNCQWTEPACHNFFAKWEAFQLGHTRQPCPNVWLLTFVGENWMVKTVVFSEISLESSPDVVAAARLCAHRKTCGEKMSLSFSSKKKREGPRAPKMAVTFQSSFADRKKRQPFWHQRAVAQTFSQYSSPHTDRCIPESSILHRRFCSKRRPAKQRNEPKALKYWLVVSSPLNNMKVSWDYKIPNIWKNGTCSKPPTSWRIVHCHVWLPEARCYHIDSNIIPI
jgi:hypothetical protein